MEVSSNIEVVFKVIGYIRESLGWIIQGLLNVHFNDIIMYIIDAR